MVHDADGVLDGLDPQQREVASTFGVPLVVIAGAGTGKTRAITHRVAYGALTGALDPARALAVTFTTRAAGEMRGRLRSLGVGGVQARTFHSAALRQIQHFWPLAYGTELPPVADNRYGLVADAASRLGLHVDAGLVRDLLQEISWSKVNNVTVEQYPALADAAGRRLASVDAGTVARVFAGYERAKAHRNVLDFDDILLCTAALLSERDDVATEVRARYRHFVVDEFQDVSPLQQTVLDLWLGGRHDLCVVGDPRQSIHAFAGARSEFLTSFTRAHPRARELSLVRDYRSTPQVVELANRLIVAGPGRQPGHRLEAQRPSGPAPRFTRCADEATEARITAEWLAGLAASGMPWREMAVLFRINAQSPAVEAALAERSIPYTVRGAELFYQRPEVRQALAALRVASRADATVDALSAIREVLSGLGWSQEAPTGGGAVRVRWESLAALLDQANEVLEDYPDAGLADVVAELLERADAEQVPIGQGVTLATMHAAKGLEWDAVALVGLHEGMVPFPLATTPEQLAEEHRLLYVGITRARTHLHLSWSGRRSGGPRAMSRFLTGIAPPDADQVDASAPQRRKTKSPQRCRVCGRVLATGVDRKLGRHTGCEATHDEALLDALKAWRLSVATAGSVPAYLVFTDATLIAVAEAKPRTQADFMAIPGIGATKWERYGADLTRLVAHA